MTGRAMINAFRDQQFRLFVFSVENFFFIFHLFIFFFFKKKHINAAVLACCETGLRVRTFQGTGPHDSFHRVNRSLGPVPATGPLVCSDLKINFVSWLYFSASQTVFTSKYLGETIAGLAGFSVNFTWSFSGYVDEVRWGLKKDGANGFESNGVLISLRKSSPVSVTVPSEYSGRVNGSGDVSSGQVIFTLSSIRKSDERRYGCFLIPASLADSIDFDSVYLVVKGELRLHVTIHGCIYQSTLTSRLPCKRQEKASTSSFLERSEKWKSTFQKLFGLGGQLELRISQRALV